MDGRLPAIISVNRFVHSIFSYSILLLGNVHISMAYTYRGPYSAIALQVGIVHKTNKRWHTPAQGCVRYHGRALHRAPEEGDRVSTFLPSIGDWPGNDTGGGSIDYSSPVQIIPE